MLSINLNVISINDKLFPAHVPSPNCLRPSSWRYAAKPIPVDQFTARGNPEQAWRAILGLRYIPYLFPDRTKAGFGDQGDSRHQLLQIVFRSRSRVEGIKVAGLGEVGGKTGAWGVVSKFSLLYKTPDHHWAYYSDSNQTPRVRLPGLATVSQYVSAVWVPFLLFAIFVCVGHHFIILISCVSGLSK